jgi:hypothetical protein
MRFVMTAFATPVALLPLDAAVCSQAFFGFPRPAGQRWGFEPVQRQVATS